MKSFSCPTCGNTVYFDNVSCEKCGSWLAFDLSTLSFTETGSGTQSLYCSNRGDLGCNWTVNQAGETCFSCSFTGHRPESTDVENYEKLAPLEKSKRKLFYQLHQLNLPVKHKQEDPDLGLRFDFLTEDNRFEAVTGHAAGIITILLSEADSVHREEMRKQMSEPYRTLLGHFRHEIAHYYWMLLFDDSNLNNFRDTFGDERVDYGESLKAYYENGAPANWNESYISPYASSHPWEDWAETWAHYLHIMDTLETANGHGLSITVDGRTVTSESVAPYSENDFKIIFDTAMPIFTTMNSMNRSMGLLDTYPFIVPEPVYQKLAYIHSFLRNFAKH